MGSSGIMVLVSIMAKIKLICVGELKFRELLGLEQKYLKKIKQFITFEIAVLKDIKMQDEEAKKRKEGEMMLDLLDGKDFVIALDEKGKTMNSLEFSRFLADKISYQPGRIVFLIGGHAGLAPSLERRIDCKLSFSAMTIAHDLFRILFLEQLYRALAIMKGSKYHR